MPTIFGDPSEGDIVTPKPAKTIFGDPIESKVDTPKTTVFGDPIESIQGGAQPVSEAEAIPEVPQADTPGFGGVTVEQQKSSIPLQIGADTYRGVRQLKGLYKNFKGLGQKVIGDDEGAQQTLQDAAAYNAETEAKLPRVVKSVQDIGSVGDAARFASHNVFEQLPIMAPSMLLGGVGGIIGKQAVKSAAVKAAEGLAGRAATTAAGKVLQKGMIRGASIGAAAGAAPMNTGETVGNLYQTTGDVPILNAITTGAVKTAIDVFPQVSAIKRWFRPGVVGAIGEKPLKEAAESLLKKFTGAVFVDGMKESVTEVLQNWADRVSQKVEDGQPIDLKKSLSEDIDTAAGVWISTGLMGGAGTAVGHVRTGAARQGRLTKLEALREKVQENRKTRDENLDAAQKSVIDQAMAAGLTREQADDVLVSTDPQNAFKAHFRANQEALRAKHIAQQDAERIETEAAGRGMEAAQEAYPDVTPQIQDPRFTEYTRAGYSRADAIRMVQQDQAEDNQTISQPDAVPVSLPAASSTDSPARAGNLPDIAATVLASAGVQDATGAGAQVVAAQIQAHVETGAPIDAQAIADATGQPVDVGALSDAVQEAKQTISTPEPVAPIQSQAPITLTDAEVGNVSETVAEPVTGAKKVKAKLPKKSMPAEVDMSPETVANAIRRGEGIEPPTPDGMVRLYRAEPSGETDRKETSGTTGRFWTPQRAVTVEYGDRVYYVDVPEGSVDKNTDVVLSSALPGDTGGKLLDPGYYDVGDDVYSLIDAGKYDEAADLYLKNKGTKSEIIPASRNLKIANLDQLPRGTGARYLEVTRSHKDGEYIAMQWRRKPIGGKILIDYEAKKETITPAEDNLIGKNEAKESLYERKDGSVYRMRIDRAGRPGGYPDFGGDLAPVDADASKAVAPESKPAPKSEALKKRLEGAGIATEIPATAKTLAESLHSGDSVKAPKGATFIRVNGNTVVPLKDADTLKGAGPFKSAEFGVKGKAGFVGMGEKSVDPAVKAVEDPATPLTPLDAPRAKIKVKQSGDDVTVSVPAADKPGLAPKDQKKFLLAEIDKAIEGAPDEAEALPPTPDEQDAAKDLNSITGIHSIGSDKSKSKSEITSILEPLFEKYGIPEESQPSAGYIDLDGKRQGVQGASLLYEEQREKMLRNAFDRKSAPRYPTVTIEVPGDGTFEIKNEKRALKDLAERMKKFPVSTPKADTFSNPTDNPSAIPAVAKRPDGVKGGKWDKLLEPFTSDDATRGAIVEVHYTGKTKEIVSTDGRRLVVATGITGPESKHEAGQYSNWRQVVPGGRDGKMPTTDGFKKTIEVKDTEKLMRQISQAMISTRHDRNSNATIDLFEMPDGSLAIASRFEGESRSKEEGFWGAEYQSDEVNKGERIVSVNAEYLREIIGFMRRTGNESVKISLNDDLAPILITGAKEYAVLMPVRGAVEPGAYSERPIQEELTPAAEVITPAPSKAEQVKAMTTKAAITDATPDGFGPAEGETTPTIEERLPGESLDDAIARKVGYQIDNGLVKIEQDAEGWVGRYVAASGDKRVFRATKKQAVMNELFADLYPNTKLVEKSADKGIQDFGQKLGGARKDQVALVEKEISDDEITNKTLSEIWPKSEVESIEAPDMAALATALRNEVPAKPRKGYKVARWVETVKLVRGLMRQANDKGYAFIMDRMKSEGGVLARFSDKVNLLSELPREYWDRIGKVENFPDAYRYEIAKHGEEGAKKNEYADTWYKKIPSPHATAEVDGRSVSVKSLADLPAAVNEKLGVSSIIASMEFQVRGPASGISAFIHKKGDPLYRHLKDFSGGKSADEALKFLKSNRADLVAAWGKVKDSDNVKETDVRRTDNRDRTGSNWRKGEDATPQMFLDTFGFRGVEFGNWVSQGQNTKERQGMLNQAFDALHDLADIIGVPPKALSLNGTMGLGMGSRGHGWASAHYEPSTIVINLTKTRGAGALAHELFHAFDHYFQRQRPGDGRISKEGNEMITYQPEAYYEHKTTRDRLSATRFNDLAKDTRYSRIKPEDWTRIEGVRPEVEQAFVDLVTALDNSPMAKRSKLIDKGKSGGYWGRVIERAARAFENYVIFKMQQKGYQNDYLANVVKLEEFNRDPGRYPYLRDDELVPVAEAFDNLFATIKIRPTDKGVSLYSKQGEQNERERADGQNRNQEAGNNGDGEAGGNPLSPDMRLRRQGELNRYLQGQEGEVLRKEHEFWKDITYSKSFEYSPIFRKAEAHFSRIGVTLIPVEGSGFDGAVSTDGQLVFIKKISDPFIADIVIQHESVHALSKKGNETVRVLLGKLDRNSDEFKAKDDLLKSGPDYTADEILAETVSGETPEYRDLWQRDEETNSQFDEINNATNLTDKRGTTYGQIKGVNDESERAGKNAGQSERGRGSKDAEFGGIPERANADESQNKVGNVDRSDDVQRWQGKLDAARNQAEGEDDSRGRHFYQGLKVSIEFAGTEHFRIAERHFKAQGFDVVPVTSHEWGGAVDHGTKTIYLAQDDSVWAFMAIVAHEQAHIDHANNNATIKALSALVDQSSMAFKRLKLKHGIMDNAVMAEEIAAGFIGRNAESEVSEAFRNIDEAERLRDEWWSKFGPGIDSGMVEAPQGSGATYAQIAAQDAAYLAAVERGDMETAQRMVDEAAKAAITSSIEKTKQSYDYVGVRTTSDAKQTDSRIWLDGKPTKKLIGGLSATDADGKWINKHIEKDQSDGGYYVGKFIQVVASNERKFGEDSGEVIFINPVIIDTFSSPRKSITRDDNGNVVPLSERFNEASNDIRYGQITPGDAKTKAERQLLEILGVHEHGAAQAKMEAAAESIGKLATLRAKLLAQKAESTKSASVKANERMDALRSRLKGEKTEAVQGAKDAGKAKVLKQTATIGEMLREYDDGAAAQKIAEGRMSLRGAVSKLLKATQAEQFEHRQAILRAIREMLGDVKEGKLRAVIATLAAKNITPEARDKALAKIDAIAEKQQKRDLVGAIKAVYAKSSESMGVNVLYRQRIKSIMEGFLLTKPSAATLAEAKVLADFLDQEKNSGSDMDLTLNRHMARLIRALSGMPLIDMPVASLEDLFSQISRLGFIGRIYQQAKTEEYRASQDAAIDGLKGSVPIEEHLKRTVNPLGTAELSIVDKFRNLMATTGDLMKRWYVYHMPMDVVFDLLDGAKHYAGANYRLFKSRIDLAFSGFRSEMHVFENELADKLKELGLTNDKKAAARIQAYAYDQQATGREKLLNTFSDGTKKGDAETNAMLDAIKLTEKEMAFYTWARGKIEAHRGAIEKVMNEVYNTELVPVENYWPMMTDWDRTEKTANIFGLEMDEKGDFVKTPEPTGGLKKNVNASFTVRRRGAGDQILKMNAFNNLHKHIQDVNYYVHVGPTVKYLQEIANRDEYRDAVGNIGQKIVREYLDTMARQGGMNGSHILRWVDSIRNNIGVGTLGFRLSSILIQPSSFFDGAGLIGGRWAFKGALNITQKEWFDFMHKNMTEIHDRIGDDWAFGEAGLRSKMAKAGFKWLQKLDQITAGSIAAGAYEKNLHERGLEVDFANPDAEAIAYAQQAVRRTQASPSYKDQPLAVTRGALMGGSRTLARAIYQFQTFSMNKFSFMMHDGLYSAVKNKEPLSGLSILAWTALAFTMEEMMRAGLRAGPGGSGDDTEPEDVAKNFLMDYLQIVPWFGSAVSALTYSSFPAPVVSTVADTAKGVKSMLTSKSPEAQQRGAVRAAGGVGTMFGIPGSSQAAQWGRNLIKSNPEEVSYMIKSEVKALSRDAGHGLLKDKARQMRARAIKEGLIDSKKVSEAQFRKRYIDAYNRIKDN